MISAMPSRPTIAHAMHTPPPYGPAEQKPKERGSRCRRWRERPLQQKRRCRTRRTACRVQDGPAAFTPVCASKRIQVEFRQGGNSNADQQTGAAGDHPTANACFSRKIFREYLSDALGRRTGTADALVFALRPRGRWRAPVRQRKRHPGRVEAARAPIW